MPKIIRHALYQKVSQLPELRQFQEDFALVTGFRVAFVDDLGQPHDQSVPPAPLCRYIQEHHSHSGLCPETRQLLVAAARIQPSCLTCDAGLQEAAVALRISGIVVGYFLFVGTLAQNPAGPQLHRIQHLLQRHAITVPEALLAPMLAQTRVVTPPLMQALLRILDTAAHRIANRLTAHVDPTAESLPPLVAQACRIIRRSALTQPLGLEDVAAECHVSVSHLSRVFHHGAGMTFREYIARWRAVHAAHLLASTHRSITQIAYDSGFQSLSQFNRVFRTIYRQSPRQMRAHHRLPPTTSLPPFHQS